MFDMFFEAIFAWNQIMLIVMALVFLGIGGLMLSLALHERFSARRVRGRIIAVHVVEHSPTDEAEDRPEKTDGFNKKTSSSNGVGIFFTLMFIVFPLIFSGIGAYMGYQYYDLKSNGQYADAVVIRNDSSYDSEDGTTTYKAILQFTDHNGQSREVRDSVSYGNSPSFEAGTRIGVYYDEGDPQHFIIDDYWHNMGIAVAFFCFGLVFVGFFLFATFYKGSGRIPRGKGRKRSGYSSSDTYYPVYAYQSADGQRVEFMDDNGSNFLGYVMPETSVTLCLNGGKASKPSAVFPIISFIFFGAGVFLSVMAFNAVTQFGFNPFTLLFALAGMVYIYLKIRSKIPEDIRKKGLKNIIAEAKIQMKKDNTQKSVFEQNQTFRKGRRLEQSEISARLKAGVRQMRLTGYVCLALSAGTLTGAYYAGHSMQTLAESGIKAQGQVTDIGSRRSDDGTTYFAIVEFKATDGGTIRFSDSLSTSHPSFRLGDTVDVLYPPARPGDAIIDRGIWNWLLSGGLGLFGLLMLWAAYCSIFWEQRKMYRARV